MTSSRIRWIDTHAHLNDPRFSGDVSEVLRRAREAEVAGMVLVGVDPPSSRQAMSLARGAGQFASVGIHPHDASAFLSPPPTSGAPSSPSPPETLEDHLLAESIGGPDEIWRDPVLVAVGETGLDYHYDHSPREAQREMFRRHIRTARRTGLPLIMHCREAYGDLCDILEEEDAGEAGGVAHCFWGDMEDAERLLRLGFYLGVGGGITFPKSENLRNVIRKTPIDRLLLETDCPYMAPVPHRGKRNEPAYLPLIGETVAGLLGISVEEAASETTKNASRCFSRLRIRDDS